LITEVSVAEEVDQLRDDVEAAACRYESMLDSDFDVTWAARGTKCSKCEFQNEDATRSGFHYCWGELASVRPHMLELFSIGTVKTKGQPVVEILLNENKASLFDVQEEWLTKADGTVGATSVRQRRQIDLTRNSTAWYSDELRSKIGNLQYPLYFIDFEISRLALPYHARMRPYGQVAFQWSAHTVSEPGAAPVHREWLNTVNTWPNKSFVTSLRDAIGDSGSVLTWSAFEGVSLKAIDAELEIFDETDPEVAAWIKSAVDPETRMVDMCKWAANDFYHPGMKGRTSIKVVMDALWKSDPQMWAQFTEWTGLPASESTDPYSALPAITINGIEQDVREGTGAMRAYEDMMYGVELENADAKAAWAHLLSQYCELDTLSMVLIFEHLKRAANV
jgi:hypothetical protein